jgi:Domain of unknown function (DUF4177)
MKKFEYKTFEVKRENMWNGYEVNIYEVNQLLQELGEEGWELCSTINKIGVSPSHSFFLIFKREKIN